MSDSSTPMKGAVLVLGASRGIGQATALALAASGFSVGVACRKLADAGKVAAEVQSLGTPAMALEVDVSHAGQVQAAVQETSRVLGSLVGVINNAGVIAPIGHLADTSPDEWARLIQINVVGAYHGMRYALEAMPGGGVIVNLSSGAAANAMEGWSAYCASKAALAMLTRVVHHERGSAGIRIYGLRPGVVDTEMQSSIRASGMNPVSQIPRIKLMQAQEPAFAIAWLCAQSPADLAGQELDIRDPVFRARLGLD